jgi:hypothetical protein
MPTTKNPQRPLTLRQQRFVHEYLIDGNGTQAARRAGYAERSAYSIASRLLRKGTVALAIQTAEAERMAAAPTNPTIPAWLTPAFVISQLRHVMELALNDGAYPAANKSLELLGRHLRMWSDDDGGGGGARGSLLGKVDKVIFHLDHGGTETQVLEGESRPELTAPSDGGDSGVAAGLGKVSEGKVAGDGP